MITQILLAAGRSIRMGRPKPLLDFGGRPILSRLIEECRRSLADSIVVVVGHDRDEILERVDLSGVTIAINENPASGQSGSLQCALESMDSRTDAFLNLPVDHPLVTYQEIDTLIRDYRKSSEKGLIFVPVCDGRQGRPVLFDVSFKKEILALSADSPVREVLLGHSEAIQEVTIDNPHTMRDMDTPQDYRQCLQLFLSRSRGKA